ncbi:MAG TPA: hypothetical protein VN026_18265 [Bacteroidia bacterium]|jgi:hypothetical protein|nr:hypothetical protein [Bacteroidia bacterium]
METDNFFIFSITGGAGKNVLATAVVKAIKKAYPETNIIILTAHRDVWLYNPNVYRIYVHGNTPNFYQDYIKDKKNVKVFCIDPYFTNDYILKKKHLIEIWCDLINVPYNNEKPELFFNQREVEFVKNFYNINNSSKIFIIQTNGGTQTDVKISWMRDLPMDIAQKVVNKYFNEGYRVIHIRRDDQPTLNNTEQFVGGLRELFSIIRFSQKRLFIDSVSQHIASALQKESTVVWVRNSPEVLGYSFHDNIVTKAEDEIDMLPNAGTFEPYDITGNIYQCPFKEGTKLFDEEEIIESINKQQNTIELI